jgi:hypothetical protein
MGNDTLSSGSSCAKGEAMVMVFIIGVDSYQDILFLVTGTRASPSLKSLPAKKNRENGTI